MHRGGLLERPDRCARLFNVARGTQRPRGSAMLEDCWRVRGPASLLNQLLPMTMEKMRKILPGEECISAADIVARFARARRLGSTWAGFDAMEIAHGTPVLSRAIAKLSKGPRLSRSQVALWWDRSRLPGGKVSMGRGCYNCRLNRQYGSQ